MVKEALPLYHVNRLMDTAMSAIVVGMEMIAAFCKQLKYIRRVVLVTNGRGSLDSDDNDKIAKRAIDLGIELTVM
jgi:ATP-dependent DNA helicase 2 subunit 2